MEVASRAFEWVSALDGAVREVGGDGSLPYGLMLRGLGVAYALALGAAAWQARALCGTQGITPAKSLLEAQKRDFPGAVQRARYFPTLLWLTGASDAAVVAIPAIGALAGLVASFGGWWSPGAFAVAHLAMMSMDLHCGLMYPWDTLLHEVGWLAVWMPALHPLSESVRATGTPPALLAFALRLMIFRLMIGFGKKKFVGTTKQDNYYIKSFFINMPICSPLGWLGHRQPDVLHRISIAIMWFIEVPTPFLFFFTGLPRAIGAALTGSLMLAIQATGNFGYFNALSLSMCCALLDVNADVFADTHWADITADVPSMILTAYLVIVFFGAVLYFPMDSWVSHGFPYWPSLHATFRKSRFVTAWVAFYRQLAPFHFVNSYGVFAPESVPATRWIEIFEGSNDGVEWKTYNYKFTPSQETDAPKFVAPYHPRLEHALFYDAFGLEARYFLGTFVQSSPHKFSRVSTGQCILQRLLEGSAPVTALFRNNPFPDAPPKYGRVAFYLFTPTTPSELFKTGRWWNKQFAGIHISSTEANPGVWKRALPQVETFNSDMLVWARRAGRTNGEVSRADYDDFWNTYVPAVRHEADRAARELGLPLDEQYSWRTLPAVAVRLRARFDEEQLHRHELTMGRLAVPAIALLSDFTERYGGSVGEIRTGSSAVEQEGTPEVPTVHIPDLHLDTANGDASEPAGSDNTSASPVRRRRRSSRGSEAAPAAKAASAAADADEAARRAAVEDLTEPIRGALRNQFTLNLLVHWIMLQRNGRDIYEATVGGADGELVVDRRLSTTLRVGSDDPCAAGADRLLAAAAALGPSMTRRRSMFLMGTFWYDALAYHSTKTRIMARLARPNSGACGGPLPGILEYLMELQNAPAEDRMRMLAGPCERAEAAREGRAVGLTGAAAAVEHGCVPPLKLPRMSLSEEGQWSVSDELFDEAP